MISNILRGSSIQDMNIFWKTLFCLCFLSVNLSHNTFHETRRDLDCASEVLNSIPA
jgi:hypothetical protein